MPRKAVFKLDDSKTYTFKVAKNGYNHLKGDGKNYPEELLNAKYEVLLHLDDFFEGDIDKNNIKVLKGYHTNKCDFPFTFLNEKHNRILGFKYNKKDNIYYAASARVDDVLKPYDKKLNIVNVKSAGKGKLPNINERGPPKMIIILRTRFGSFFIFFKNFF